MAEEAKVVPVEESKETKTVETKTEETPKETVKVGDALKDTPKDEPKMVPEAVLIEYKKESKAVRKELDALKKSIEEGATKKEVSTNLKELAEKHNVDADFLNDFANAVRKEAEDASEAKLKPIKDKEIMDKADKAFDDSFEKALAENPEYAKLVNKDVIKTITFNAKNADKELNAKLIAQMFESSYGHLVTGKKTIESTKPRGGKEDISVDLEKAANDPTYFSEIMADPELKKKYNESMHLRNRF